MRRVKLVLATVIAILVLIVILQNTESVETQILAYTFTLPRALLLGLTFVFGFLSGVIWTARYADSG